MQRDSSPSHLMLWVVLQDSLENSVWGSVQVQVEGSAAKQSQRSHMPWTFWSECWLRLLALALFLSLPSSSPFQEPQGQWLWHSQPIWHSAAKLCRWHFGRSAWQLCDSVARCQQRLSSAAAVLFKLRSDKEFQGAAESVDNFSGEIVQGSL